MRFLLLVATFAIPYFFLFACSSPVKSQATSVKQRAAIDPEVEGIVQREIANRKAKLKAADEFLLRGDALMNGEDPEAAMMEYRKALEASR